MNALFALLLALPSPAPSASVKVGCQQNLNDAVERLQKRGGGLVELADGCTWPGPLKVRGDAPIALKAANRATIKGGIWLSDTGPVRLENLTLTDRVVALKAERVGPLLLVGCTLMSEVDGLHVHGAGPVALRQVRIFAGEAGAWMDRVDQVEVTDSNISAGELALSVRHAVGPVRLTRSRTRSTVPGLFASVYLQSEAGVEITDNMLAYLGIGPDRRGAVLEVHGPGRVADNVLTGPDIGIRIKTDQLVLGCNRITGPWSAIQGRHQRDCGQDLAPHSLDWRERIGGRARGPRWLQRRAEGEGVSAAPAPTDDWAAEGASVAAQAP